MDTLRHLDLARHPPLHGLHPESVRHQRGPLLGRNQTAELLQKTALEATGLQHDPRGVAEFRAHHLSTDLRMVSAQFQTLRKRRSYWCFDAGTRGEDVASKTVATTRTRATSYSRRWAPSSSRWSSCCTSTCGSPAWWPKDTTSSRTSTPEPEYVHSSKSYV